LLCKAKGEPSPHNENDTYNCIMAY
jgi:hypothetical protein